MDLCIRQLDMVYILLISVNYKAISDQDHLIILETYGPHGKITTLDSLVIIVSYRYNPENLATLECYVETQARENAYDLEANLAVLKL